MFLRRNGIKVKVVTERASVCPINDKNHPYFNVWTGCTSLVNIIDLTQSKDVSVIVVDRGIFDTMIWMRLLLNTHKITESELRAFEDFYLMERWTRHIDLVIHMTTTPASALEREFAALLTEKSGSIMNENTLSQYNTAAEDAVRCYASRFQKVIQIDTTAKATIDGVEEITREVLGAFRDLSDEELIVVPRAELDARNEGFALDSKNHQLRWLESTIKKSGIPLKRTIAEKSPAMVQLVPCVVLTYGDEVLLFTKRELSHTERFHERQVLWIGGHLRTEDLGDLQDLKLRASLEVCLRRELQEEISLSPTAFQFRGLLFDRTHPRSLQHLGVLYSASVDGPTMTQLDRRTFKEFAGQELDTRFVPLGSFASEVKSIEPWSAKIADELFGIKIEAAGGDQLVLF